MKSQTFNEHFILLTIMINETSMQLQ